MTHTVALNLMTFALAIPGAVVNSLDLIQKVKFRAAKGKGRPQKPTYRDAHPIVSISLNLLMVAALAFGFWLTLHPPQVRDALSENKSPQSPTKTAAQVSPNVLPEVPRPERRRANITKATPENSTKIAVSSGGSISQSSTGGCSPNVIGSGNITTANCSLEKYKTDGEVCGDIQTRLAKYSGTTISILGILQWPHDNGAAFQESLGKCLERAGIHLKDPITGMDGGGASSNLGLPFSPIDASTGITIAFIPDRRAQADDILNAIVANGLIDPDNVRELVAQAGAGLEIIIAPRQK
jgi:hypothetical protein